MYKLSLSIETSRVHLHQLHEVNIESSWQEFTDTAVVQLPYMTYLSGTSIKNAFKTGDAISIKLGYDEDLQEVFKGYIARVEAGVPIKLHLEDEAYLLKKRAVAPKQFTSASLAQVLNYIGVSKFKTIGEVQLGTFVIDKDLNTAAKVLNRIKESYGLHSFYRQGLLNIGTVHSGGGNHKFHLQNNVISDELEFKTKDEIRLEVEAKSYSADGKVLVYKFGDTDGEKRTLHYYGLGKSDLEKMAKKDYERFAYEGFHGKFTAFGAPLVRHGEIVQITDDFSEKTGRYYVDAVTYSFGMGGYRQDIELGKAAI